MYPLFFVLLEMYTFSSVYAFSNGSITGVCDSMTPVHSSFVPQKTKAPYRVTVDRRTCRPGDMIRVTLESVNSNDFEGFMLQARATPGDRAVGYFKPGDTGLIRLHDCFYTKNSGISHSSAKKISQLEVMWVAPLAPIPNNITFCATFVRSYNEFWTMVASHNILLSSSPTSAVNCLMMSFCLLLAVLFRSSSLNLH